MKKRQQKSIAARLAGRFWKFDGHELQSEARRRTKLHDFGEPALDPALTILLKSLDDEACLHPLGRMLMRMHLRDLLEVRLRLVEQWKREAERLKKLRIERPVFIVGMPRSGSTYLHELLAENPDHRAPRVWEVMFPVGSSNGNQSDEARRLRKAAFCLWCFRKLAPKADAVYPMRAMTPHECVAIHSYTLMSEEFISTCHVPSYEAFMRQSDLTPVYAWQKRFLEFLHLDSPDKRWILKSPDHVYGLEKLLEVFPDASIIQTHRNPVEVLKSSAELTRVIRGLYGPAGEPEEIQLREARALAEGTERFMQFRDSHPELAQRIIDVRYTDLIADPMAVVQRICEGIRAPVTPSMARRVKHLASNRSRYRGPRASAHPASLGLDRALGLRFERYCSRFGLPYQEADLCR